MKIVPFSNASYTDLIVDAVYQGGRKGNAGDDPLPHILRVSNSGGFRYRGQLDALELLVLTKSSKEDHDWPDMLDRETGVYTYFGDNKSPGDMLHETPRKGNEILQQIFNLANSGKEGRQRVPPILLFANTGDWRDVVFLGLAVPGTANLRASEDLVALWRISNGSRFQNYRARFSILDVPSLSRSWIQDIISGNPHSSNAPLAWLNWVMTGKKRILLATRSLKYRTKLEQIPDDSLKLSILETIIEFFQNNSHGFIRFASLLTTLLLPDTAEIDLTQSSRYGERDAIGKLRIGNGPSGILVDFALEAKCCKLSVGVGVSDVYRVISRLRHRQFGILVTTSYVNLQAYREIKEDQHPIIIISGTDIVELLRSDGYSNQVKVKKWLEQNFSPRS